MTFEEFLTDLDYQQINLNRHLPLLVKEGYIEKNIFNFLLEHKYPLYNRIETYIKNNIRKYRHDIFEHYCYIHEKYPNAPLDYSIGMSAAYNLYTEAIANALGIHMKRS